MTGWDHPPGAHMTRRTNARIAGFTFLFYIAVGITNLMLSSKAVSGTGITEKLTAISAHTTLMRLSALLGLLECFSALTLAVTLYAITRDEDQDLAMMGLVSRLGEGLVGAAAPGALGLLWLATNKAAGPVDAGATNVLSSFLLQVGTWTTLTSATFFVVGSTFFSWLFLRGRMIPVPLAWLGFGASVLLVVLLPLQLAGFLSGPVTSFMWLPMLAFEAPLGVWLIVKGVAPAARRQSA
jgi:hypothetical protein